MTDVTYTVLMPILWSALEPCLAITLACVPLLRPLFGTRTYTPGATSFEPPKSIVTIGKKRSRAFNKLGDEYPITQVRQEDSADAVSSRFSTIVENEERDVELITMSATKDWRAEQRQHA